MPATPPLTLPQLAEIVGTEYRTLHSWAARGLIRASIQASRGTGSPNLYTLEDAVVTKILVDLRRAGLALAVLEQAAETLWGSTERLKTSPIVLINGRVDLAQTFEHAGADLQRAGPTLVYHTDEALQSVRDAMAERRTSVAA